MYFKPSKGFLLLLLLFLEEELRWFKSNPYKARNSSDQWTNQIESEWIFQIDWSCHCARFVLFQNFRAMDLRIRLVLLTWCLFFSHHYFQVFIDIIMHWVSIIILLCQLVKVFCMFSNQNFLLGRFASILTNNYLKITNSSWNITLWE